MLERIQQPILEWYDSHSRILPWREDTTPYKVWVSEIMLQQTRVEAVKPFYDRFITALPTVADLANCEEDRLMKLWEGLGYYNRVRNMQKAAVTIMEEYGGELPADYEQLLSLSGIGSYTAGAIASIAYQKKVPAVDGNVLRVITRLTVDSSDILKQSVKAKIEKEILKVMPKDRPGDYNQALIELGAIVCVPNGIAKCDICPLKELCEARKQGRIAEFPQKTLKKPRKIEEKTILVLQESERVAIHRRAPKGLLAGLYELPNLEGHLEAEEVLEYLKKQSYAPIRIQQLEESKHIFSHVEWRMTGYVIRIEDIPEGGNSLNELELIFADPKETEEKYSIPAAFAAYTKYMNIRLGQDKYKES
jgi:A/G-specific adenine glycosylase